MLEKAFYMYALITIFLAAMACRPVNSQTVDLKDLKVTSTSQAIDEAEKDKQKKLKEEEEKKRLIQSQNAKDTEERHKRIQDGHQLVPTGKETKPKTFNPATQTWE